LNLNHTMKALRHRSLLRVLPIALVAVPGCLGGLPGRFLFPWQRQTNSNVEVPKSTVHTTPPENRLQGVSVEGTTLPRREIAAALDRAGCRLNAAFSSEQAERFAQELTNSYESLGFYGVRIAPISTPLDNQHLRVAVKEAKCAVEPINVAYYRAKPRNASSDEDAPVELERVRGVTRPSTISFALGLMPGKPFQWSQANVQRLRSAGLFQQMALRNLTTDESGDIRVNLDVVERPSYAFFQPGVKFSVADRAMCGEVVFKHDNILGSAQQVDCRVAWHPGATDATANLHFANNRFGASGGTSLDLFQIPGAPVRRKQASGSSQLTPGEEEEEEEITLSTRRRGLKGRVRLASWPWGSSSIGGKVEAIELSESNCALEIVRALKYEGRAKLTSPGELTHDVALDATAGISNDPIKEKARDFFTGLFSSKSGVKIDDEVSLRANVQAVAQSASYVPQHERQSVAVRGASGAIFAKGPGWCGLTAEVHRKLPGEVVGTLFVDGAVSAAAGAPAVGSCGAGLLVGPLNIELVRYQAKNKVVLGLR